jgi:hypothetical protein
MAPLEAVLDASDASKAVRHYQTHRTGGKSPWPPLFNEKGVFYCGASMLRDTCKNCFVIEAGKKSQLFDLNENLNITLISILGATTCE